ncbi:DUF1805 domain-containing protein [Candidatus Micrarchaeota archaeon]|nr:DUF1805 domain-containing protein [Candidatus Micrarchaeota archaeon]
MKKRNRLVMPNVEDIVIEINNKKFCGHKIFVGNMPLIIIYGKKGYIASSYINKETAEKLGDIAGFVTNIKDFDDLTHAKVKYTTSWAEDIGIRPGMSIQKALSLLGSDE